MSTQTDLEALIDMGFEKPRAEMAVKKAGGCEFTLSLTFYLATIQY